MEKQETRETLLLLNIVGTLIKWTQLPQHILTLRLF